MTVELIACTSYASGVCCDAAAVCTASQSGYSSLQHSMASGHESVLEHAVFTFKVTGLSRAALAQLTRHRLASFSVQSQRYVKMNKWGAIIPDSVAKSGLLIEAEDCIRNCMDIYQRLLDAGVPAEDARYVTPQALTTELIMTMNARELRHFFSLRCCNRAQWEIRRLADRMLKLCRREAPTLFENAGPGCTRGHCPEKKPCGHPGVKEEWNERKAETV